MGTQYTKWDDEVEDARIEVRRAKAEEEEARRDHTEKKLLLERGERSAQRSDRNAADARSRIAEARRRADEARRKGDEDRRKGLSIHRWANELHRWEAEGQRANSDMRRFEDEGRRFTRDSRAASAEARLKGDVVSEMVKSSHKARQKFSFLLSRPKSPTVSEESAPPAPLDPSASLHLTQVVVDEGVEDSAVGVSHGEEGVIGADGPAPLEEVPEETDVGDDGLLSSTSGQALSDTPSQLKITAWATGWLKSTLDGMARSPAQLLRLVADAQGTLSLYVDTPTQTDAVVFHDGAQVLLIDADVLSILSGATLDVTETPAGTSLRLDR